MIGWCTLEGWSGGGASVENRWWTVGFGGTGRRMVLQRVKGGVEVHMWCGFMEEKEMHGGVLSSRYAEAERGEGREWGPRRVAAWKRKGGGGGDAHAVGGGRIPSAAATSLMALAA
jgi:hypothetical protein